MEKALPSDDSLLSLGSASTQEVLTDDASPSVSTPEAFEITPAQGLPRRPSWYARTFSPLGTGSLRGSVFMLVSGAIGAGIVALPYTLTLCGLPLALALMTIAGLAALLSLQVCCVAQQTLLQPSYDAVIAELFPRATQRLCVAMLALCAFGLAVLYLVLAAQTLAELVDRGSDRVLATLVLEVFCAPAAYVQSFDQFRYASLLGIAGIGYFVVLTLAVFLDAERHTPPLSASWWSDVPSGRDVLRSWSIFLTAFVVHNFVFAVADGLANPTAARLNKVLFRATGVEVLLYAVVAAAGFATYKHATPENLLVALGQDGSLGGKAGQAAMLVQLCVSHCMGYFPLRRYAWAVLHGSDAVMPPSKRFAFTTALVLLVTFAAVTAPEIVSLMGLVGGFAGVTYAFTIPAGMLWCLRDFHTLRGPGAAWMSDPRWRRVGLAALLAASTTGYLSGAQHALDMLGVKL
jgi:amino acid permease